MKNRDLKKMSNEEKKRMRKEAATVMGEILAREISLEQDQSEENLEIITYKIEREGEE